jgi:putative sigma-54 modulation protein
MNIAITFRHLESTEAIKDYCNDKVGRLQKFLRKPMKANVTLAVEKGDQIAEVTLNAGSEHYTAKESSENMYASVDRVCDKLLHQMQHAKTVKVGSRRGSISAGEFARISQIEGERAAAANEE